MFRAEDIGRGNRLRFNGDNTTYYSKNKDVSNKFVFVTKDGTDQIFKKAISKIIQVDNKKLNEVARMQQLAGINEIKVNNPKIDSNSLMKLWLSIDIQKDKASIAHNLIYNYAEKLGFDKVFNYKDLFNELSPKDKLELYNQLKEL